MDIVTDDRVAAFVSQALDFGLCPPWTCLGIEKSGRVVAGVVFNHFEGHDLHVTIAGHGWTRRFAQAVGDYVYRQLGCERMTAITEQASIVHIAERMGGQVEGLLRNHFGPGRDAFVIGILRDEYRFLEKGE
ncbi:GNAT family N-acetyltransferase [Rhizobium sp. YTUHZ044]|uniref:GNAT family N-acetyltransferase n=1 Tax=Rhizobium sp. YTUHZ044 TaxID=2962678 RepID=UPI003DA8452F